MPNVSGCAGAAAAALRLDVERLADAREQRVGRKPVQVADHAVVVEDPHLVVRERDGEEELVARVGASRARCAATRAAAAER